MPAFLRSRWTTLILGLASVWLGIAALGAYVRLSSQRQQMSELTERIANAKQENGRLAHNVERMQKRAWLALLARERLNYKLPDETVVFVYKSEKDDTIGQPPVVVDERSHARKWLDWMRGR